MFQTELTHFLQSFESDILTKILFVFTNFGYKEFFLFFVMIFMFGINFKKGMLLTHVLIITGLVTAIFKNIIALPRPYQVDASVKTLWNNLPNLSPFTNKGATSFWGLPDSEVIDYYRLRQGTLFGIPSGHTSTAVTLWGSIYLLYKKSWVLFISTLLIVVIPFSRLYLGRHFLADVIGGFILGGLMLFAFYHMYYKKRLRRFSSRSVKFSSRFFIHLAYQIVLPILFFFFFPSIHTRLTGVLLGINFLLIYFTLTGFPLNHNKVLIRILTTIVALIFFSSLSFLLYQVFNLIVDETLLTKFVSGAVITAISLLSTVKLCIGLKLMQSTSFVD